MYPYLDDDDFVLISFVSIKAWSRRYLPRFWVIRCQSTERSRTSFQHRRLDIVQWSLNARAREDEVVVNSGSSGGAVKQELEHNLWWLLIGEGLDLVYDQEGPKLVVHGFEPGRTPKTDKPAILDDASVS
ncbi:hypothetical protein Rs2_42252 [Raphanus sativus]|nr:hypothetical protein Rs2_42252 [Raphanus sativus]